MATSATVSTTLSVDDNSSSHCESATVTSTTTLRKNESAPVKTRNESGKGTFTAKFERPPGAPSLPDFTGRDLYADPNAPPLPTTSIEATSYEHHLSRFLFTFPEGLPNGTHDLTLSATNAVILHQLISYPVDGGKLNITVDNGAFKDKGEYAGTFTIQSHDGPGRLVTITGEFNFTTVPE
ncbi:hypothetical protein FQ192_06295 [Pseudomonas sp. ANT_J12]|uniref:hypothetical protein n=1 Tax=Pseudomonas sp. ANT_J12 TaxID=2597351 RepID=UPI0011F34DFE|nr:hypothetical protein [Pseudomonas sp. ANT_J12]KAA0995649.1 hypothetical protein FQ192_06295 [Pseudomonas sp. ANT_J12]